MGTRRGKRVSPVAGSVRWRQLSCTVPAYSVCVQIAALVFLSQIACSTQSSEPLPPAPTNVPASATSKNPADTKVLTDLREQLEQVTRTGREMKAILEEVPAQKQKAEELRSRLAGIKARVGAEKLEAALKEQRAGELEGTAGLATKESQRWTSRARALDQELSRLPVPPPVHDADSTEIKRLKTELRKEIQSLQAMQAATQLAFRALSAIDGLERSVNELEKTIPEP